MSVRCRLQCTYNAPLEGFDDGRAVVEMAPLISSEDDENASIFAGTPGGALQLVGVKADVAEKYEIGKEYFIDIVQALQPISGP